MINTTGIHHVTSIASDPQQNVDFYTEVLGLRLVKKTLNFDDKYTYHLYYGDEVGTPGTILTFFPFENGWPGRVGRGQTSATAFVIPEGSVEYWIGRLESHDVEVDSPRTRFDETVVPFRDYDGQPLELVTGTTNIEPWTDGPVPVENAIRGFHSVTLESLNPEQTGRVLDTLGYEPAERNDDRTRYRASGDRAAIVDVRERSDAPARTTGRWNRPPRGISCARRRDTTGVARAARRQWTPSHVTEGPSVLQIDLLPGARGSTLRDRHRRAGIHP